VDTQTFSGSKKFATHGTQIRSWLVIIWMLSDIVTISFNLPLKRTFICVIYTTTTRTAIIYIYIFLVLLYVFLLQCFDGVCWATGKALSL